MTTVLHTADTHLGYSQYHSETRAADFDAAFRAVIDEAIKRDVDAVIHSGDLFHHSRPDVGTLSKTLNQLQRLDDAGIPFLGIVGNHEGTSGEQWVDIFGQLKIGVRLGREPTVIGDTAFYGLDYVSPARRPALDYAFEPHDADCAVLAGHGLFAPVADGGRWKIKEIMDASPVSFDGFLFGDDHMPHVQTVRDTTVTYPGSTDRTQSDQRAPRGFNIVTTGEDAATLDRSPGGGVDDEAAGETPVGIADDVDTGERDGWPENITAAREIGVERATEGPHGDAPVFVQRHEMYTRPFRYVRVMMDEGDGMGRVRTEIDGTDLTGAVAIVHLTGDGDPVLAAPLEEYAREAGAMVARVTDNRAFGTDDDETGDISFADPETAVDRRLQEMVLSVAGHDIEAMVRSGEVPTSSMADSVEGEVGDRIREDEDDFIPIESDESDDMPVDEHDGTGVDGNGDHATSSETDPRMDEDGGAIEATDPDEDAADSGTGTEDDEREMDGDEGRSLADTEDVGGDEGTVEGPPPDVNDGAGEATDEDDPDSTVSTDEADEADEGDERDEEQVTLTEQWG